MDKMKQETPNLTEQNIDRIAALFPNCVTEATDESGKIKRAVNFELLKQMLSPDVVDGGRMLRIHMGGQESGYCGGEQANPQDAAPLRGGKQGLGQYRKPVYRGRQSGSPQAFAGKLSRQGQDDIYRYKDTKIDTI